MKSEQAAQTTCRLRAAYLPPAHPPAFPPTLNAQEGHWGHQVTNCDLCVANRKISRF